MATLRGPDGCPWDREQTHQSLTRCLVEECAETLEAIDEENFEHLCEELGDLLLQVVMHACLAEEEGHFDLEDVARRINEKLIHRHPHVFGDQKGVHSPEQVLLQWEELKAREKGHEGKTKRFFKNSPPQLPALLYAHSVYKQGSAQSALIKDFCDPEEAREKGRALDEQEAGRLLFSLVAACREAGVDPEAALRRFTAGMEKEVERRVDL
jgi:XTP/dITP diphosphohydrolase/tetrapyrrole methylase family protein/MazG family protein